jgi:hypothetical protein
VQVVGCDHGDQGQETPVSSISFFIVSLLSGGNSETIHLSITDEVWAKLYHTTREAENK